MARVFVNLSTMPDSDRDLSQRLPSSTTIAHLRRRWTATFPSSSPDLEIRSESGRPLDVDLTLADLPSVAAGSNTVHLIVVEPSLLSFSLSPGTAPPWQLSAFLSYLPSALLPRLRECFHLAENQNVRLLTEDNVPLALDRTFEEQGVMPNALLTLEAELRIHPRSQWPGQNMTEAIRCYPSDVVGQTLTSGLEGDFQLQFDEQPLSLEATIGEALQLNSAEEIDHWIDVYSQRTIFLLTSDGVRQVSVAPDSTIAGLGIFPTVICDGYVVPNSQAIADFESHLLVSDVIVVTADFCGRGCTVLRLSRHATVGDLRDRLATNERPPEIALFFRGQRLCDLEATLSSVGIGDGARVEARKELPLSVSLKTLSGHRSVLVTSGTGSVTYNDLRMFHANEEQREGHPCLSHWHVEFRCDGCQRRIFAEENGVQLVPSPCCEAKSLSLTATRMTDESLQTLCGNRTGNVETQTLLKTEDKQTSTRSFTHVCFDVMDASGNSIKEVSVQCSLQENLSDLLQKVSKETDMNVEEFGLKYQFETTYFREGNLVHFTEQLIHSSTSSESQSYRRAFVDINGEENSDRDYCGVTSYFIDNLDDLTVLRGSIPIVTVDSTSIVMEFGSDEPSKFCRVSNGLHALKDMKYFASIHCLRVSDRSDKASEEFYVISERGQMVSINTGQATTTMNAVAHIPLERRCIERVYLLLCDGCRLPKWPFPAKLGLSVFFREGVIQEGVKLFDIKDGVVKVIDDSVPTILSKRWICYKKLPGLSHSRAISQFVGKPTVRSDRKKNSKQQ